MTGLACYNVKKQFGGATILEDVSITFPRGTISAIVGTNGAGKTTLFNALTGYLEIDGGKCFLDRKDITDLAPYRIVRLGIARTFQRVRLFWDLSVADNLLVALPGAWGGVGAPSGQAQRTWAGAKIERIGALLDLVGLGDRGDSPAKSLSYGQRKLLSIACSVATGASVFLFDEPIAGLDPTVIEQVGALLRNLRDEGFAVVFIEHDLDFVRAVATSVAVLSNGSILKEGEPGLVLADPVVMESLIG